MHLLLFSDDNVDGYAISQFIEKSPLGTPTRRGSAFDMPILTSHLALPHLQHELQQQQHHGSAHSLTAPSFNTLTDGVPPSLSFQDVTGTSAN